MSAHSQPGLGPRLSEPQFTHLQANTQVRVEWGSPTYFLNVSKPQFPYLGNGLMRLPEGDVLGIK